ncbi:MAG TPA: protein-methionine-sulfoxide reductase heme-binding subunit MsrQ [Edaphobacter sp.]
MSKRALIFIKTAVHILCLLPLIWFYRFYSSGQLALNPDPINFITHFTGDWALWILLASLAITPLRRLSPRISWLIRLRRMIGLYAFLYATLHLSTYLFLFSGYDVMGVIEGMRANHPAIIFQQFHQVWPFIWDDVLKRRFVQVGFLSWLILLALAITSPAAIMRAMGGKNWQRLHRLVYLAAIAAVLHYWWLVKTGVLTPWKVTAVLTLLLLARVIYLWSKSASKVKAPAQANQISPR